jgi:hypothetical protein
MRVTRTAGGAVRPFVGFLVALLIGSIFVVLRLQSYDWNPTGFVHAGDRFVDPRAAPPNLVIRRNEVGFDGTGFYRLAIDPFSRERTAQGIEWDLPAFRHQRILYPLIAWAGSGGGNPSAAGWALIAVNLAGFAGLGFVGGLLARDAGRHALWGLLLPSYPGFAVSLGLDTAEIVAALLGSLGILLVMRRRFASATFALVAAMLTRETTLLIAIGVALGWVIARMRRSESRPPVWVFALPGAAYVAWEIFLHGWLGEWPLATGSSVDVAAPLTGLVRAAQDWPRTDGTQATYQYILVVAMIAFVATVALAMRRSALPTFAMLAFGAGAVLATLYSDAIWLHHWGFLRAFTETYVLGAVLILTSGIGLQRVAVASGALWVSIAINLVLHP